MVKISIISVVYNDRLGLKETIDSVKNQSYLNFEFIVVDGCSSDGTVDIIKENEATISVWVSEPDKGIYDAMNKGIDLASGDFAIFLNAGDVFYSKDTLNDCVKSFTKLNAIYFGRAENNSEEGNWLFPPSNIDESNISSWLKRNVPNHQAMFFPRSYYKGNYYDLSLKISADADYKWRAMKDEKFLYEFINSIVSVFEIGGTSTSYGSWKKYIQRIKDSWKVNMKYHGVFVALKRQFSLFIKFLSYNILGESLFNNLIKSKYK